MSDRRSRILSNAVFLGGHAVNVVCTLYTLREGQQSLKDKRVADMKKQMFIFLTIWNIAFQLMYLLVNIICEAQELYEIKDRGLLNPFKTIKQVFFDSILVPTTLGIFVAFWPLFIYDRGLLYPQYVDDAIGSMANYVMHAFILLVVVWEMRYMTPKEKHRVLCLVNMGIMCAVYIGILFYNHGTTGMFPYPILYKIYGTVYFPMLLAVAVTLMYVMYHVQWPLRRLLSIHQERKKKSIKSK